MMMDGEWRVAFVAAEHPELAVRHRADARRCGAGRYGAGYINGTIIGIPERGKNRDEAWKLVKYLTTNDHALATFSNGIRNVPSTRTSARSKELKPDKNFAVFTKIFTNPKSGDDPDHRRSGRRTWTRSRASSPSGSRARSATSPAGLEGGRQADRREDEAGRRRRPSVISAPAAGAAAAAPAAGVCPPAGQAAGDVAPPRHRPALPEPVDRRASRSSSATRS